MVERQGCTTDVTLYTPAIVMARVYQHPVNSLLFLVFNFLIHITGTDWQRF